MQVSNRQAHTREAMTLETPPPSSSFGPPSGSAMMDKAQDHLVEEAICSVEKFGEMLLTNVSAACLTCTAGVDSILDENALRLGCGPGMGGPPTAGAGQSTTTATGQSQAASMRSMLHERAFPPLANVIVTQHQQHEKPLFRGGDASTFLSLFFDDAAPMSMERFHTERGDDDVRFGPWTALPSTHPSRLERGRSDIGMGSSMGTGSGGGRRHSQQQHPPPSSQSLLGDVPTFLLTVPTLERHASFRTPVRLPVHGMSVTEVSVVQRLLHLGGLGSSSGSSSGLSRSGPGGPNKLGRRRGRGAASSRSYVVETVLRLLDVPYSDRFQVVIRTTLETVSSASSLPALSPQRRRQQQWQRAEKFAAAHCGHAMTACSPSSLLRDDGDSDPCSCPIPGCSPRHVVEEEDDGGAGRRRSPGSVVRHDNDDENDALIRVEFEIRFDKGCQFEDRIRKMLTKKMTKLLRSWCSWAEEGWVEVRAPSSSSRRRVVSFHDEDDEREEGGGAEGGGGALSSPQKKWQSLWNRDEQEGDNDAMLLWSMTDLEGGADGEYDLDEQSEQFGGNVGFQPMEWRNMSLSGNVGDDDDQCHHFQDQIIYRGHGVELCLCDVEGSPHELPMPMSSSIMADCGQEVVYVTDESSDEEDETESRGPSASVLHPTSNNGSNIRRSRSDGFRRRSRSFAQTVMLMK